MIMILLLALGSNLMEKIIAYIQEYELINLQFGERPGKHTIKQVVEQI